MRSNHSYFKSLKFQAHNAVEKYGLGTLAVSMVLRSSYPKARRHVVVKRGEGRQQQTAGEMIYERYCGNHLDCWIKRKSGRY